MKLEALLPQIFFFGQRQAAQCVGRVIRSKADYGMMIFADSRLVSLHLFLHEHTSTFLGKWEGSRRYFNPKVQQLFEVDRVSKCSHFTGLYLSYKVQCTLFITLGICSKVDLKLLATRNDKQKESWQALESSFLKHRKEYVHSGPLKVQI